jgi:hypothetical protein
MHFFDYSTLSGLPPIGIDLNFGAVLAVLLVATLLVSAAGIVLGRKVGLPRRVVLRWPSTTRDAVRSEVTKPAEDLLSTPATDPTVVRWHRALSAAPPRSPDSAPIPLSRPRLTTGGPHR